MDSMYDFIGSTFAVNMCVYMANKLCHANGIEVRCPFIAPELVEFMDSLPMEMKFNMSEPKMFQKQMMAGILPNYILYAKKRAFEPPFEFVRAMVAKYQYKRMQSSYCFFNSMVADRMIDNLLRNV